MTYDESTVEKGLSHDRPDPSLRAHTSSLPNFAYIVSFAPPIPSIRQPYEFFHHPLILYAVGTVTALAAGVGLPAFDIVLGYWTKEISRADAPASAIMARGSQTGWIMTMVGFIMWICFGTFVYCFTIAGVKLSSQVREKYLAAVMVQDQAFFDRVGAGEIVTRSSKDIDSIRIGLGERLGYLLWALSTIISAFVSAFVHSPKLAGVLFAIIPFTAIVFTGLGYWTEHVTKNRTPLDGQASSFIEQMLSSVRVVQSFEMSHHLLAKLEATMLSPLRILSRKVAFAKALEQSAAYGSAFLVYSMCFWYGGIDVSNGNSVGNVLTTFYNYINLFFAFATVVPHLIATTTAISNISNLRLQIERIPSIDVRDESGKKFEGESWSPSFELDRVTFAYPSRPGNKALDDVSVNIAAGKFTAFAGPSGSGKSTLASLLLRMYDPKTATTITDLDQRILKTVKDGEATPGTATPRAEEAVIDGAGVVRFAAHDVRDINLTWLRSQVAVVLQNPQLVGGTVFDNVVIGLTGTEVEYRPDVHGIDSPSPKAAEQLKQINELVEDALRKAQAWDFVRALPNGISTVVFGGRTGVLSGGQVQRVALARALVRQPKCLLLDEATSAVSADAELLIQESLVEEQRRTGMTLIIIAHRLSTLVAADKIIVMQAGRPVHSGTYDELVDPACPDPTFRDMALASSHKHQINAPKPSSRSSASTSDTVALSQRHEEKIKQPDSNPKADPLPPAITNTWQVFSHVRYYLFMGIALGLVAGAAFVVAAWLHGRAVASLNIPDFPLMRRTTDRWALWFVILAIATFLLMILHVFGLENGGELMVSEFRLESVRALIRQDIPFFERESNGLGSLISAAAHHPANVGSVIGVVLAQFVTSSANFVATVIMAFILNWRLAVMVLPALTATMTLGYLNYIWLKVFEDNIVAENENQANYVADAVNSAQLIASLTREKETLRQYNIKFSHPKILRMWLIGSSMALAGTQAMLDLFAALMFYWGAKQVAEGNVSIADLFTVIESVVVAIYICAKILTYTGDFTRMRSSLATMQGWLDRIPDTVKSRSGAVVPAVQGEKAPGFTLSGVQLRYPSRPDVLAIKGIDVHLEPGRSYAFCGTSGAGKSSILALLQRFYEPSAGTIMLDGQDVRSMDTRDLRAQMGYVSQEPVLFEGTIRWNLIAGSLTPHLVSQEDLEFACAQACILDFIQSLPDGFETDLGIKGGQLSGGQRQRLCIARALLRRPRILLLDEATSALDGQSEAHVQKALDNASKGRLTITIGHRLSSIKGADVIFVMEQGVIVETGTHEELVEKGEKYFELVQAQL